MHMDDNQIHKVKLKYYKIIDFPGITKGLNPLQFIIPCQLKEPLAHLKKLFEC